MNERFNLIFMPISIINGMANSKRLNNFYINLKDNLAYSVHNLAHEPDIKKKKTILIHETIERLNYFKIRYNYKNTFELSKFICFNFKILKKLFDIKCTNILYHSGYPNIRNIIFILFAKVLGYKVIFDILEDNSTITNYKSTIQRLRNKSSLFFFRYIYLFANGITCISDSILRKVKNVVKGKIPVVLIPASIDVQYFSKIREKSELAVNTTLFYGGSFGEKDGIGYLLSAFDILANNYDVTLIMTGQGNEHDMLVFKNKLQQLRNKDKIQYRGYLEDIKYYELLNTADIHCMVRIGSEFANAGFPFKLAEMLATGKPVIATRVSDVVKYLGERDAFLIEPENTNEIIEAVKFIIDNPLIAKKVGENGKSAAQKNFNSKKIAYDLMSFIQFEVK